MASDIMPQSGTVERKLNVCTFKLRLEKLFQIEHRRQLQGGLKKAGKEEDIKKTQLCLHGIDVLL